MHAMLVSILLVSTAHARDEQPEDTGPAYIVNGDEERGYPSAVAIGLDLGMPQSTCSSSLLTPRILLTAAHCTEEYVKMGVPEASIIEFGRAFFGRNVSNARSVRFEDFRNHPDYEGITGAGTPENDFGVVILEDEITDIDPVWIETNRIGERDVGKRLISVGYGITSAATQQGAGTRRSTPIEIAAVEGQFIVSYTAQNPGEGNVCSGDSGGPQYFENEDGTLTQWSVHSWADQNCQFASGSSRTDVGQEWILNQVERVHGTTDRCEIYGMYANGVCDEACDQVDPECSLAQGGEATDEAGGGPTSGKACGCTHTEPGHAAAASLVLLALLRRRART